MASWEDIFAGYTPAYQSRLRQRFGTAGIDPSSVTGVEPTEAHNLLMEDLAWADFLKRQEDIGRKLYEISPFFAKIGEGLSEEELLRQWELFKEGRELFAQMPGKTSEEFEAAFLQDLANKASQAKGVATVGAEEQKLALQPTPVEGMQKIGPRSVTPSWIKAIGGGMERTPGGIPEFATKEEIPAGQYAGWMDVPGKERIYIGKRRPSDEYSKNVLMEFSKNTLPSMPDEDLVAMASAYKGTPLADVLNAEIEARASAAEARAKMAMEEEKRLRQAIATATEWLASGKINQKQFWATVQGLMGNIPMGGEQGEISMEGQDILGQIAPPEVPKSTSEIVKERLGPVSEIQKLVTETNMPKLQAFNQIFDASTPEDQKLILAYPEFIPGYSEDKEVTQTVDYLREKYEESLYPGTLTPEEIARRAELPVPGQREDIGWMDVLREVGGAGIRGLQKRWQEAGVRNGPGLPIVPAEDLSKIGKEIKKMYAEFPANIQTLYAEATKGIQTAKARKKWANKFFKEVKNSPKIGRWFRQEELNDMKSRVISGEVSPQIAMSWVISLYEQRFKERGGIGDITPPPDPSLLYPNTKSTWAQSRPIR